MDLNLKKSEILKTLHDFILVLTSEKLANPNREKELEKKISDIRFLISQIE